jgi:hypothetical protein
MKRNILLVARELEADSFVINEQKTGFAPVTRQAHEEIEKEIAKYGRIDRQRTSGFLPRLQTPPEGIDLETVLTDPASHPTTIDAITRRRLEQREFFRTLFSRIDACDHLVVVRDGYSDLRGAMVMYAHERGKSILALQRYSRLAEPPYEPLYDMVKVTNIRYEVFEDAKPKIYEYFYGYPLPAAG